MNEMKTKTFIILIAFTINLCAETKPCKWLFEIPTYPDMEPAGAFSSHVELFPPFITRLKVYKPREGKKIEKQRVIKFYDDFYADLGWEQTDWKQQLEFPYLQMNIRLNVYHSGELQLWISPDGELLTIYMNERRVVSGIPASFKEYPEILKSVGKKNSYSLTKATRFGWEQYYENEFLQTCELYSFYHDSRKSEPPLSWCTDPRRRFQAVLLLYKNEEAAAHQKRKWESEASHFNYNSWQRQTVIQDGNILLRINNGDKNQCDQVSKIALEIENYSNQSQ
jgi:hypothetical protein